jgi:ubiquinone/menaquinone biosynthesis C-methylase UbiE
VLDVACGSGIVARTVAAQPGFSGTIVGLDLSPAMLAAASRASAAEGGAIEWVQGSAQELPFPDASFDLIFCQQGLQFFPDRQGAVIEMARVLAPGGEAAITTWRGLDENPFFAELARAVHTHFSSPALEKPFSLGDPGELGSLLIGAGFTQVSVEPVSITTDYTHPHEFVARQIRASAAAIPALQALAAAELDALIASVQKDFRQPVQAVTIGDRLQAPMQGIVARGVRT